MNKAYPGKFLGNIYNFQIGEGVYIKEDNIISSLLGEIIINTETTPSTISVINRSSRAYHPKINDEVYCKVNRVTKGMVYLDIISTKNEKLDYSISALLKYENVKNEFKSFSLFDCFVPGDYVLGKIITTDLTNNIFISTIDINHGVVFARGVISDCLLMPISFDKMICVETGLYENRKVAKPKIA